MLAASLLLALVFSVLARDEPLVCTTESLGTKATYYQVTHAYFIGEGQSDARLILMPDPECSQNDTVGLSVTVCDFDKEPSLKYSDNNTVAYIARTGSLDGKANVLVNLQCQVPAGPYYLPKTERQFKDLKPFYVSSGENRLEYLRPKPQVRNNKNA